MSNDILHNARFVRVWPWFAGVLVWVVLDQITKYWAEVALAYGRPHYVLPVLDFTLLYNTGAAFSFLSTAGGWQRWFLTVLASIVSLALIYWLPKQQRVLTRLSFALILSGALGNLIDRVRFGHVIDFIHFHWQGTYFPAFNLADMAISVGVALLAFEWFREGRDGGKGA